MSLKPEDPGRPSLSPRDPWSPAERPPGAFPPSPRSDNFVPPTASQTLAEVLRSRKDEYTRKKTIKIKIGTWNTASVGGAEKDLGGWFAKGFGALGTKQDLSGVETDEASSGTETPTEEIESVQDQERRHDKKHTTIPEHDTAALPSDRDVGLYVLGLQEVVDVSSVTETIRPYTDPNPARKWKKCLRKALPTGYHKVVEQQLLGLLLIIFASPEVYPQISCVDSTSVGTGVLGYLGNKGAVSARLLLGESTRLAFVNCHLAAGADQNALTRRIWDTNQILSRTKFTPISVDGEAGKAESIGDEDCAFWFGDLNYRLDGIPGEDVRRLLLLHARNEYDILNKSKRKIDSELGYINASQTELASPDHFEVGDDEDVRPASTSSADPPLDPKSDPASLHTTLQSLLSHDQLRAQQRLKMAFHDGWREGDINFLPTYKYDIGSVAMFDSGEKKRNPSWCDRILYRTKVDRLMYEERVRVEEAAKKKDEEMKNRGLDNEAAQEDVLFDYNPDTDGGNYYDDADDAEDGIHDAELVQTGEAVEDMIQLSDYISHQRVLSSDHKPLSAVFDLTYDSVIPELKAVVHQEIARHFDKAENEGRPNVTVVLDTSFEDPTVTDHNADATELKIVDLGEVRYGVRKHRNLILANTGQMEAVFGLVDRPGETKDEKVGPLPAWLQMKVDMIADLNKAGPSDLGSAVRYRLQPGETTNIEISVKITDPGQTRCLNDGSLALDDVLVLRISNGRDHFIPVRGRWLQTCFFRSIDELVRIPNGVRALSLHGLGIEAQHQPPKTVHHSAPQELFTLTDAVPGLVERVVAEWDMLNSDGQEPPWLNNNKWPFEKHKTLLEETEGYELLLSDVREALDTSFTLGETIPQTVASLDRLHAIIDTLLSFLSSLQDGIIIETTWAEIEARLVSIEKAKTSISNGDIQSFVMEALSSTPIHSVSFTFITFMLSRIITELCASASEAIKSPALNNRPRSSTTGSEALSDVSISSEHSTPAKRTFLPSLSIRSTNQPPKTPTTPILPADPDERRKELVSNYSEIFAKLIIRLTSDAKMKAKDKKNADSRRKRVIEAFLDSTT